ncbi:MAG TPA: DNA gyrase inhibitor YacG [Burkholderiaceae bacterium]|nr:DNA gyrase inhibitor YacG [Burkholderiaceae bacterium]
MPLQVDCPCCGRRTEFSPENRWRPFCSQRCRQIDLGAWASDQYVIAGNPQEKPLDDGEPVEPRKPER